MYISRNTKNMRKYFERTKIVKFLEHGSDTDQVTFYEESQSCTMSKIFFWSNAIGDQET
jgi:hypothetical protein